VLPVEAYVDLDVAAEALARAEASIDVDAAAECLAIAGGGFLTGDEAPWVDDRRRDVEALRLRALEALATAGLELGGARLLAAEDAARALVEAAPFRESAHCLLMSALAARGDVPEALRAYDELRVRLRDELGTAPGPEAQAIHRRLLDTGEPEPAAPPATAAPHEERKLVTVLAATLAGADPEDLRVTMQRAGEVAAWFGGTAGAGQIVFGAPVAHEDDAERAVMAALRMLELGLATRAGVATGEAIVSPEGAVGPVSAGAARLESAAQAGQVVADEATMQATRHALAFGPGGVVRGPRGTEPGRRTRLIGRRPELRALRAQHAAVRAERRPRLVTILGQAGIGKSRLLDELLAGLEDTTLCGRCLPYGEGIAYWALREVLWEAAGIGLRDSAATAAAKLARTVEDLLAEPDERVTAALAASAGITLPGGALDEVSPETLADEIALAWPRFLSALAAREPVVVAIEDLHWADAPLIDMVRAILTRSDGPLLLVATARPELAEAQGGWGYRPGSSQVAIEPLTRAETSRLAQELGADPPLAARVAASAEGNPFFAQELVRHAAEAGQGIPNTVRAVLAARMDALGPQEKRALQHAAVVGRAFWPEALRDMPGGEPGPDLLRTLEERGFVAVRPASSLPGHRELWFAHGLTREVAYRSLPRAERCLAHAAVARFLEGLAGDRREEFVELLAHHLEAAAAPTAWPEGAPDDLRAGAVQALVEAGEAARRRHSSEAALRFAARALALAATPAQRLAATELQARSFAGAVRAEEALESFEAAIALAGDAGDGSARSRLRALVLLMAVRYMGAFSSEDWLDRVEAIAADPPAAEGTLEDGALALWRSWGGERRREREIRDAVSADDVALAKHDAARAIEIAESIGSSLLHAVALEGLTWISFKEGLAEAAELGERHLRAAAILADHVEAHESYSTAAICFANAGRFAAAREATFQAIAQSARLSPHRALHAAASAAVTFVPTGRFAELLESEPGLEELAAAEGERLCATGAMGLAGYCVALHETGHPAAERAFEVLRAAVPPTRWLGWGHPLTELLRPAISPDETRERLRASRRPPEAWLTVRRLRTELVLDALAGEWDALDDALVEARALAASAAAPALGWHADWAEAVRVGGEEGLALAEAATGALAAYGERYTAGRLMAELLARVDAPPALVASTAEALEAMGAHASAALARDGDAQAVSR
jgi:tetratricopeptide (TPR) repeat protein